MEMVGYSLLILKNKNKNPFYNESEVKNENDIKKIVYEKKV